MKDKLTRHNNHKVMYVLKTNLASLLNVFNPFQKLFANRRVENTNILNIAK